MSTSARPSSWLGFGPVRFEVGQDAVGVGDQCGEAGDDESAHLSVLGFEDGLCGVAQLGVQAQRDGGRVGVLVGHTKILARVACNREAVVLTWLQAT